MTDDTEDDGFITVHHTRQIGRGTVQTQPGQPMPEPVEVWPAVAASGGAVRHEAVKDVSAVCDELDAAHEVARLRKQAKLYQSIITAHTERHHAIMERAEKAEAEVARLRGLLWFAWHEFNAVRAREGTTNNAAEEWWSQMTDMFGEAIGTENNTPWPSPEAKAILAALKGEHDE